MEAASKDLDLGRCGIRQLEEAHYAAVLGLLAAAGDDALVRNFAAALLEGPAAPRPPPLLAALEAAAAGSQEVAAEGSGPGSSATGWGVRPTPEICLVARRLLGGPEPAPEAQDAGR